MFLLNLSLGEFLAIFSALSGVLVALYLLDRSRRRQKVATLRFWMSAQKPAEMKHRKRIQQPWSLLLQLISIGLLLLALAQLQLGSPDRVSRDHILILDTSAWMNAKVGRGVLMDAARATARSWLRLVPPADRVMVVRADALATPATALETNREVILDAIRQSSPGSSALNLEQALTFADRVRKMHARRAGEIVVVGAGRIPAGDDAPKAVPAGARFLVVPSDLEDVGLRKIGLRRSPTDPDLWDIFVSVRNYGHLPQNVPIGLQFGNAPAGSKRLTLAPGAEQNVNFEYRTKAAGWMEIRLFTSDAFPQDDRALLELPAQKSLRVIVYSNQPELLRPLFAGGRVQAQYRSPAQYQPKPADTDVMILDGFGPPAPPEIESVWIEPPAGVSPAAVATTRSNVEIRNWRTDHELGAGLRLKDVRLASAEVYRPAPNDIPVAETESGPVILARPGKHKMVILGFHPMRTEMRYELATPLLFANIFRWMSPETFRRWELNAGSVGTVAMTLDKDTKPEAISVTADGHRLPYTVQDNVLRFFAGNPASVRVQAGDRDVVYSLTLPDVADAVWTPPADVRKGLPRDYPTAAGAQDAWQWLAVLGGLGLLLEWILFGRRRQLVAAGTKAQHPWREKFGLRRAS